MDCDETQSRDSNLELFICLLKAFLDEYSDLRSSKLELPRAESAFIAHSVLVSPGCDSACARVKITGSCCQPMIITSDI